MLQGSDKYDCYVCHEEFRTKRKLTAHKKSNLDCNSQAFQGSSGNYSRNAQPETNTSTSSPSIELEDDADIVKIATSNEIRPVVLYDLVDPKEVVYREKLVVVLRTRGLEIEDDISGDQLLSRVGQLAEDNQELNKKLVELQKTEKHNKPEERGIEKHVNLEMSWQLRPWSRDPRLQKYFPPPLSYRQESSRRNTPPSASCSDPLNLNNSNIVSLVPRRRRGQLEERVADRKRQTSEQESSHQQDSTSRHTEAPEKEDAAPKGIPLPLLGTGLPSSPDLFSPDPEFSGFIRRPLKRPNTSEDLPSQRKKQDSKMLLEPSTSSAVDGSPRSPSYALDNNSSDGGSSRSISASSVSGSASPPSSSSSQDDIQADAPFHPHHSSAPQATNSAVHLPLSPAEEVYVKRERQKKLEQERRVWKRPTWPRDL